MVPARGADAAVPGARARLPAGARGDWAAVALTAGFAGVTFVRLIGMVVLGQPRPVRPDLPDFRVGGRAAIVGLGAACLVLAALTPLEIRVVAAGLSPIVPAPVTGGALKSPWVLQPVFAGGYESDVIEMVGQYVYRPLLRPLLALGRWARRLQSGRLDAYLAYMLIAVIALLAVVIALA